MRPPVDRPHAAGLGPAHVPARKTSKHKHVSRQVLYLSKKLCITIVIQRKKEITLDQRPIASTI
jgi:hypothetical protein